MAQQKIIILNGTSSAGKTSIAKALQDKADDVFLHFKMDVFWYMVPTKIEANSKNLPHMKLAILDSAKALLDRGHNVILDIVCTPENIDILRQNFTDHDTYFIAVKADLETINKRERERGNRKIGLAQSQFDKIHTGIDYDFEIDTTHKNANECADIILSNYLRPAFAKVVKKPAPKP